MATQNDFVLYRYLMFFWKKKWLFLIIPLLLGALVGIYSYMKEKPYVGTVTVFTGDVVNISMTNAKLLSAAYAPKELPANGSFKAAIPVEKQALFTVTGTDKAQVQNALEDAQSNYIKDLNSAFKDITSYQEEHAKQLDERINALNKSLESYRNKLDTAGGEQYIDLVINAEDKLSEAMEQRLEVKEKLAIAQAPQIISSGVVQSEGNLKVNILVTVVLGLFLTFLGMILWKYLLDAKQNTVD